MTGRPRWREVAGPVGLLEPGPRNSITDVTGVTVGHAQAASGERTGVTVVMPPRVPVLAGTTAVNGVGELTGNLEIEARGTLETPVYLCGSHAVGQVMQAAVIHSGHGPDDVVLPVVGECDDGLMADSRTVTIEDALRAVEAAGTSVAEGTVGAGTGMSCYDYPGGIGTASRRAGPFTVGVLLLCNFGERPYLDLLEGLDVAPADQPAPHGSCITVCATDAPVSSQQLKRLALRPMLGLARTGSYAAEGSGEIGLAFTTAPTPSLTYRDLDPLFAAAYESAHEAVYNALVAAEPRTRLDGSMQDAFPVERVAAAWRARRSP